MGRDDSVVARLNGSGAIAVQGGGQFDQVDQEVLIQLTLILMS